MSNDRWFRASEAVVGRWGGPNPPTIWVVLRQAIVLGLVTGPLVVVASGLTSALHVQKGSFSGWGISGAMVGVIVVTQVSVGRYLRTRAIDPSFAMGLTALASALAGRRRSYMGEAWRAHLAGAPEEGIQLSAPRRVLYAIGFVIAALRMRLHDVARPVWRPVDWLLMATVRTEAFITTCVGSLAVYIESHDGFHTLVTDGWGWCGGCGLALFGLTRWLRRIRGIELTGVRTPSDGS